MSYIIFGLPGAGKGTISNKLKLEFNVEVLSTGNLLREEVERESELGLQIKKIISSGELVADDIMIAIIKKKLTELNQDILFDGFPRTLEQAKALDKIIEIKAVIYLKTSDEVVISRLLNRVDEQGNKRNDDRLEVIKNRLEIYHQNSASLFEYYKNKNLLMEIDASQSIDEVFVSVKNSLLVR